MNPLIYGVPLVVIDKTDSYLGSILRSQLSYFGNDRLEDWPIHATIARESGDVVSYSIVEKGVFEV
jgi:hypothetical protein